MLVLGVEKLVTGLMQVHYSLANPAYLNLEA